MRPGSIIYFLREAFKSLSRNRLLSFATISTVAISILILGFAVLLTINASALMNYLESDVEIVAFLEQDLTKSQIDDVKRDITAITGVKSVNFVSREKALDKLQESYGGENPLPHSYEIKADDPHNVSRIAAQVQKIDGIYKVNYGQGVVERLFKVTRWVRIISIVFIILLVFAAIFLIATTIRLAIFARRKEIYLMKLIGSTDWFVRWPFFIEGIFLGALGGLIAILILIAGYGSLIKHMDVVFFLPLVTNPQTLGNVYLGLLICGAVLGAMGTWISLNRFLDV